MGPLEGSHLRTRPTSPPAHILRLSKAMTQGKGSNGGYVMELLVSLSGAWVKMRFSDVHPEITRDAGVTRHSLPVVTSEREDSSSPTPHTVSQDTNKSYAEFFKQMVEGDDGEDGGKDDPRPEAYADDSPVQTGWELAQGCLLYTSDAADDSLRVDLGGRRIIKKDPGVRRIIKNAA